MVREAYQHLPHCTGHAQQHSQGKVANGDSSGKKYGGAVPLTVKANTGAYIWQNLEEHIFEGLREKGN